LALRRRQTSAATHGDTVLNRLIADLDIEYFLGMYKEAFRAQHEQADVGAAA
jgi:hypothetical protein